jgi:hypothetical protein
MERARDRLRRAADTSGACYDDMAVPRWDSFRVSRARFLAQAEPRGLGWGQGGTARLAPQRATLDTRPTTA